MLRTEQQRGAMLEYAVNIEFNELDNSGSPVPQSKPISPMHLIQVYPDPVFKDLQVFTDKTRIILIEVNKLFYFKRSFSLFIKKS